MAIPVLVGIPALISSIAAGFGGFAAAVAAWISSLTLRTTLHAAASLALAAGFYVTLRVCFDEVYTVVNGAMSGGGGGAGIDPAAWSALGAFVPDSTVMVISCAISADVGRYIYDYMNRQLDIVYR